MSNKTGVNIDTKIIQEKLLVVERLSSLHTDVYVVTIFLLDRVTHVNSGIITIMVFTRLIDIFKSLLYSKFVSVFSK